VPKKNLGPRADFAEAQAYDLLESTHSQVEEARSLVVTHFASRVLPSALLANGPCCVNGGGIDRAARRAEDHPN
jgi:hypothetical protein